MVMAAAKKDRYLRRPSRRRPRTRRLSRILSFLLFVVAVAGTLGHVWIRVDVVRQQMKIVTLQREVERLQTDNEYLRVELRDLSGIQQLEAAAKSFGFIYPRPENIVRVVQRKHH
jgi:cell division protein FtsL